MALEQIPQKRINEFCRRNHVRRLSCFGSFVGAGPRADSDIDVLVEFDVEKTPGYLGLARMQRELEEILGGRRVDLKTPNSLSPSIRKQVEDSSIEIYARNRQDSTGSHA